MKKTSYIKIKNKNLSQAATENIRWKYGAMVKSA